jgi:hypothetical protein
MGKVIVADDKVNFKVTGVVNDFPKNSTFRADMLFPMSLLGSNMYANNKKEKILRMISCSLIIILFCFLSRAFHLMVCRKA